MKKIDKSVKLHIDCIKSYLEDYINVNIYAEDENIDIKCDCSWDMIKNVGFKKESVSEIFVDYFPDKVKMGIDFTKTMLTNFRYILKSDGLLKIGLDTDTQRFQLVSWLNTLGFKNVDSVISAKKNVEKTNDSIETDNSLKLHVGCGRNYFQGWINIDNNSDHNIERLDLNFDLRNPLPYDDNTVDFIYNEHFLEHLTVEEGLHALKDFKRVLKPNGVIRIAMPDLEETMKIYFDPNWKSYPVWDRIGLGFVKTRAKLININFRAWGHKWLYDAEELERRLKEAGFKYVRPAKIHESSYSELNNIETRNESTLIAEASMMPFNDSENNL